MLGLMASGAFFSLVEWLLVSRELLRPIKAVILQYSAVMTVKEAV